MMSPAEYRELYGEPPAADETSAPLSEEQRMREFYESIRDAEDVEAAVRDLTSRGLRELGGYLMRNGASENNVAGDVLGRLMVEGWRRFAAMKEGGISL